MGANSESAKRGAATMKARYGANIHQKLGAKGGAMGDKTKKGFAGDRELASRAGKLGGKWSPKLEDVELDFEDLS